MSLTEKVALSFGKKAKEVLNVDEEREEVIVYGAINLLQTAFNILAIILISLIFGVLYEGLLFSVASAILRKYSGGVHASSSGRCIIMGTLIAVVAGILIGKTAYTSIGGIIVLCAASMLITMIIVIKNSPIDSENKPIDSIEMRQKFKKISVIISAVYSVLIILALVLFKSYGIIYFIKAAECIALGSIWQAFTLTKVGSLVFNKGDFVLKYIMERKLL